MQTVGDAPHTGAREHPRETPGAVRELPARAPFGSVAHVIEKEPMILAGLAPDFAQLYQEHFDLVWRALRRYGVPQAELEDALQEVFLTVHDRFESFEGRSSLRTWIYGIARRIARDHRPTGRFEMTDPVVLDANPAISEDLPVSEEHENASLLRLLLAELTPERREIVVLVELEQMTVSEAAEVLKENPNTLQSRLRLAKGDLAKAWTRIDAQEAWRSKKCAAMNGR